MLSVIIPTLNEAENLPRTLGRARDAARGETIEWIVSDCRSIDGTAAVARRLGARGVEGSTSRAEALNRGAAAATGDRLMFLHADTMLPAGFARAVGRALETPGVVGGAFAFRFNRPVGLDVFQWKMLGVVALMNNVRFRVSRNFYGDQAIFVHRAVFERLGGFPLRPLLEDLHFSRRLKQVGLTAVLSPAVHSSARRFLARGIVHQTIQDIRLILADSLGVRLEGLMGRYNGWNHRQFRATPTPLAASI